jgi:hypothetical protein
MLLSGRKWASHLIHKHGQKFVKALGDPWGAEMCGSSIQISQGHSGGCVTLLGWYPLNSILLTPPDCWGSAGSTKQLSAHFYINWALRTNPNKPKKTRVVISDWACLFFKPPFLSGAHQSELSSHHYPQRCLTTKNNPRASDSSNVSRTGVESLYSYKVRNHRFLLDLCII